LYDCSAQTSIAICGSVLSTLDINSINKVVVVVVVKREGVSDRGEKLQNLFF